MGARRWPNEDKGGEDHQDRATLVAALMLKPRGDNIAEGVVWQVSRDQAELCEEAVTRVGDIH